MRITTLVENSISRSELTAEHGLSLWIEWAEGCLLFDAGQTEAFADNAARLGIRLSRAECMVLSHGHYDHGGGLPRFLAENSQAPVYLSRYALEPHYHGAEKNIGLDPAWAACDRLCWVDGNRTIAPGMTLPVYLSRYALEPHYHGAEKNIGLDPAWAACDRLCWVDGNRTIAPGMTLLSLNGQTLAEPVEPFGLQMGRPPRLKPEDFCHEQYLMLQEGTQRVLFSGCSHKGIINIAEAYAPDVLVGGFHLSKLDPAQPEHRARLEEVARRLLALPTVYHTCHCTGDGAYAFLKARMGKRLHRLRTGDIISL